MNKKKFSELNYQIQLVIDKHTYINRIENILKLL